VARALSVAAALTWLVVVGQLLACAPGAGQRASASTPAAATGPRKVAVDVATGFVTMSGATEVTCSLDQVPQTDDAILTISAISECKTKAPLQLTVKTSLGSREGALDEALPERDQHSFSSFRFPLPPGGTLVRTIISAPCTGAEDAVAWGTGRCVVQVSRDGGSDSHS